MTQELHLSLFPVVTVTIQKSWNLCITYNVYTTYNVSYNVYITIKEREKIGRNAVMNGVRMVARG